MHRNTVYGHDEWRRHKSSWRHARHVVSIAASGVIAALGPPVFVSTITAIFVTVINHGVKHGLVASWVPYLRVSPIPFTLISPVLAFLLVFRTNSSYQRFDEARKVWGSNLNRCRDLARQALSWIKSPEDSDRLECLLRFLKSYPYYLKLHLTETSSSSSTIGEIKDILKEEEFHKISLVPNQPIFVLQVISEIIVQCNLPNWERITMDANLTQFEDNVGACERIFKTPIPVAYTRLTSRMLILWHLALPYGLWNDCRWLTIPATFLSSAALFYIEQVGVLIEEPFCILALDSICGGIRSSIDMFRETREEIILLAQGIHSEHPKKMNTNKNLEQIVEMDSLDSDSLEEPKEDEVMISLEKSKSTKSYSGRKFFDKSRSQSHTTPRPYGEVNIAFSKLKSVS